MSPCATARRSSSRMSRSPSPPAGATASPAQWRGQDHLHEGPPASSTRRRAMSSVRASSASSPRTSSPSTPSASSIRSSWQQALWAALEERERIYAKHEMTDADGSRLGELEGIVGEEDGYEPRPTPQSSSRASTFPRHARPQDVRTAGRQKVRVLLAQALFGEPQALLLDEPTNYLDSTPSSGCRTSSSATTARSSPSPTTATSSTPSAPTSRTSTTRPSSSTTADTTTWSSRRRHPLPRREPE